MDPLDHRAAAAGACIFSRPFGVLADGRPVRACTLVHASGMSLTAINLGGIVTSLRVPDRHGRLDNVVLALASLDDYAGPHPHLGTIVGRCANRIAQGRFVVDGQAHQVPPNDGPHALHGGPQGLGRCWWDIRGLPVAADGSVAMELHHASPDGDQGFPGTLQVTVRYTLGAGNAWRIDYRASTDRPTVVNLTHHDYFNLAGGGSVTDHRLQVAAGRYCEVDAGLIPTRIAPVDGTPFDFRRPVPLGARLRDGHPQLRIAGGYDHCWVLDAVADGATDGLHLAARLDDPASGRRMTVFTTEPGLQVYAGQQLDGRWTDAAGRPLHQHAGVCLETQHLPDAPNRPDFPSTLLRPGQVLTSTTLHRFDTLAPPAGPRQRGRGAEGPAGRRAADMPPGGVSLHAVDVARLAAGGWPRAADPALGRVCMDRAQLRFQVPGPAEHLPLPLKCTRWGLAPLRGA